LGDSISAPNSISILTPESSSTLTGGDKVVLSLSVLTYSNQQEHYQIAYEKTTGSKEKKEPKQGHVHCA
jgi:hypothetical protein